MRRLEKYIASFLALLLPFFYGCSESSQRPITSTPNGTYVNGEITADAAWIQTNSPYIVTGDVTVSKAATLTIEPGTEIQFDGPYRLTVQGRLVSVGAPGNPILFTTRSSPPQQGSWKGIQYENTGASPNLLQHTKIEYAEAAITCEGASPEIMDSRMVNNQIGVALDFSHAHIAHNVIQNNDAGIVVMNASYLATPPVIRKNIIAENETGIVITAAVQIPISLSENNIDDNYEYGLFVKGVCKVSSRGSQKDCDAVDARDNWWGSVIPDAIAAQIFDREDQPNARRVMYTPYAQAEIPDAGPRPK